MHVVAKGSWNKRQVGKGEVRNEIGKNEVGEFKPKLEFF